MEAYKNYRGFDTAREDFEAYWKMQRQKVASQSIELNQVEQFDFNTIYADKVWYRGLDGTRVFGWHIYPKTGLNRQCMFMTHGYRCNKSYPTDYFQWLAIGLDVFVIDMRLQGGETGFNTPINDGMKESVLTINIYDLETSYLGFMYTDMLCGVRVLETLGYDAYFVRGGSQAGGMALMTGALAEWKPVAILADVFGMSDLDQRVMQQSGSFKAFSQMIANNPEKHDLILKNLSYFDIKNMAHWITSPIMVSLGGMDPICPPNTIYATYNRIHAPKQCDVYPFAEHNGGGALHQCKQLRYVMELMQKNALDS